MEPYPQVKSVHGFVFSIDWKNDMNINEIKKQINIKYGYDVDSMTLMGKTKGKDQLEIINNKNDTFDLNQYEYIEVKNLKFDSISKFLNDKVDYSRFFGKSGNQRGQAGNYQNFLIIIIDYYCLYYNKKHK